MRTQLKILAAVIVAVLILGFATYDNLYKQLETYTSPAVTTADVYDDSAELEGWQLYGPYDVERIVDGDTIVVTIDGVSTKVRLIGVDTPESVHPDAEKNVEYGKIASEYTKALLDGNSVWLEYDVGREDRYERTLAYVYLKDSESGDCIMLNRCLLQEGHAVTMTVQPNSKYTDEFYDLQVEAREAGLGLWAS